MNKFLELLFLKNLKSLQPHRRDPVAPRMRCVNRNENSTINKYYIPHLGSIHSLEECIAFVKDRETDYCFADIEKTAMETKRKYESIINDPDINVITVFDDSYPEKLLDLKDQKPVILYVKGNINALSYPNIAIVGTRRPSEWSIKVESRLVRKLIDLSGRTIISGLALGCDKIAHETTVSLGKRTVAVLPSGVNVITPAAHKELAKHIIENGGCLISEYEPNAKATKSTYVERDAVIAALSDATIVVECDVKSGTMHTVNAAKQMKRKLACYYIADTSKGNYAGNELMMKEKGAYKISDTNELVFFLESIKT